MKKRELVVIRAIITLSCTSFRKPNLKTGKNRLAKFLSRKISSGSSQPTSHTMTGSQSWDSAMSSYGNGTDPSDTVPDPPPIPTVEYLLGKRPISLRRRANQTLKDQIKARAAYLAREGSESDNMNDSDEHSSISSSVSSKEEHRHHHKKGAKHKRKRSGSKGELEDTGMEWNYNQLALPQSSPPRVRRDLSSPKHHRSHASGHDSPRHHRSHASRENKMQTPPLEKKGRDKPKEMHRVPTPMPSSDAFSAKRRLLAPQKLEFDVVDELDQVLELLSSSPSSSPTSLSPLNSPSTQSSPSSSLEVSPIHSTTQQQTQLRTPLGPAPPPPTGPSRVSKRQGPKLQPHLQNRQIAKQSSIESLPTSKSPPPLSAPTGKMIPTSRIPNSRNGSKEETRPKESLFKRPKFLRQFGRSGKNTNVEPDDTIDDIESQLNEMKQRLVTASAESMLHTSSVRPPSPEAHHSTTDEEDSDTDSESSDYTSSSEYTSTSDSDSSSEDSSDDELQMRKPLAPKRPIMVKNVGMSANSLGKGGFNRGRMLARYPRLFRKKIVNLDTIKEVAEEIVYAAVSYTKDKLKRGPCSLSLKIVLLDFYFRKEGRSH